MSMLFYLAIFLLAALFAYLFDEYHQKWKLAMHAKRSAPWLRTWRGRLPGHALLVLSGMVLILVRGLRYGIASDYFYTYVPRFEAALNGGSAKGDIVYDAFIWLCALISTDYSLFFFIDAVVFITLVYVAIKQAESHFFYPVLFFCLSYNYLRSFQFQSQYMAMAITLIAVALVTKRKYLAAGSCCVVAFGIHVSAAIMVIPIAVSALYNRVDKHKRKSGSKTSLFFLSSLIVAICLLVRQLARPTMTFVAETLMQSDRNRFTFYFGTQYDDGQFSGYLFAVNAAVLIFMLLVLAFAKDRPSEKMTTYIICQSFALGLCLLTGVAPLMYRFIFYLAFPQTLSLAFFLYAIQNNHVRFLAGTTILFCFAAVQFGYLMPADTDIVFTYQSIIDRPA